MFFWLPIFGWVAILWTSSLQRYSWLGGQGGKQAWWDRSLTLAKDFLLTWKDGLLFPSNILLLSSLAFTASPNLSRCWRNFLTFPIHSEFLLQPLPPMYASSMIPWPLKGDFCWCFQNSSLCTFSPPSLYLFVIFASLKKFVILIMCAHLLGMIFIWRYEIHHFWGSASRLPVWLLTEIPTLLYWSHLFL